MESTAPARVEHAGTRPRFAGLDGLRAIAVLLVVSFHFGAPPGLRWAGPLAHYRAGYLGVTLFFTLSGFLITYLLLHEHRERGGIDLRGFYVRRGFRLVPALIMTLVALVLLGLVRGYSLTELALALLSAVGYVYNIAVYLFGLFAHEGDHAGGWGHLWSLAIEEQFYLFWPVLLAFALARRVRPAVLLGSVLSAAAVGSLWRIHLWRGGAPTGRLYLLTDARIDNLLIGVALAVALFHWPSLRHAARARARWLTPAVAALLVLSGLGSRFDMVHRPGWMFGPGMTVVAIISALIVWLAIDAESGGAARLLRSGPLVAIGRRSYGIYLFHFPVQTLVQGLPGGWFLSVVLTAIVTELSFRFVEGPLLRRVPRAGQSISSALTRHRPAHRAGAKRRDPARPFGPRPAMG